MEEDRKDPGRIPEVAGIEPEENSELKEILRDKRIFGVFHDEDEADRAIRQLNLLGYGAEEIFLFSQNQEAADRIKEGYTQDFQVLSCSDGSDFIGKSYDSGDLVICVPRNFDPDEEKRKKFRRRWSDTTVDVQARMNDEKNDPEDE